MTIESEAINIAKTLLGIGVLDTTQNTLLLAFGNIAEKDAVAATLNETVLAEYELLGRMIQAQFNRRNSEGITNQSLATVSETYSPSAYPESVNIALRGFRKLRTL